MKLDALLLPHALDDPCLTAEKHVPVSECWTPAMSYCHGNDCGEGLKANANDGSYLQLLMITIKGKTHTQWHTVQEVLCISKCSWHVYHIWFIWRYMQYQLHSMTITITYVAAVRVLRPYILNSAVPGVQQPSRTTSPAHLDIVKSNNSSMQLCFNTKCIGTVVV